MDEEAKSVARRFVVGVKTSRRLAGLLMLTGADVVAATAE